MVHRQLGQANKGKVILKNNCFVNIRVFLGKKIYTKYYAVNTFTFFFRFHVHEKLFINYVYMHRFIITPNVIPSRAKNGVQ